MFYICNVRRLKLICDRRHICINVLDLIILVMKNIVYTVLQVK